MLFNIVRMIRDSIILTNVRFVLKYVSCMVNDIYDIGLKYILRAWTGFICHNIMGDSCEHGDESSGPIKGREFMKS
jgi:hypothetical protein